MKQLYKELIILLIAFFAFVFFVEWRVKDVKAPIDRLFLQQPQKPLASVLIIGNSHTGVLNEVSDTEFLQKSINMSLSNLELEDRYKVLQNILKGTNIKTVILAMDPDQLGHNLSTNSYDAQLYKYGFALHYSTFGNRILSNLNFFRLRLNVNDLIKTLVKGANDDTAKINFIPFTNKERNDQEACKKRAQEHSVYNYKIDNNIKNLVFLQKIIDVCKEKKIQLLLLQTPKPECYSEIYLNEKMIAATEKIDSIAKKNQIRYLNYFNNPNFPDSDFADYDHLNQIGSNKLLTLLKDQIN